VKSAVETIDLVLSPRHRSATLLKWSLVTVPTSAATAAQILAAEAEIGHAFSEAYRAILNRWNGLDLDVIHFYGLPSVEEGVRDFTYAQRLLADDHPAWTAVAGDPAGFLYAELPNGEIVSIDHDGGQESLEACSFDEFVSELLFGARGAGFLGGEWLEELGAIGLA
jgi:hypothetical protein